MGSSAELFHQGLIALWKGNNDKYQAQLLTELSKPEIAALPSSAELLVKLLPEKTVKIITESIERDLIPDDCWRTHAKSTLKHATTKLDTDGTAPFKAITASKKRKNQSKALSPLINCFKQKKSNIARDLINKMMEPLPGDSGDEGLYFFSIIAFHCEADFFEEWIPLLFGTSIKLQDIALQNLNKSPQKSRIELAEKGLKSRKASERFGAILLLKDLHVAKKVISNILEECIPVLFEDLVLISDDITPLDGHIVHGNK